MQFYQHKHASMLKEERQQAILSLLRSAGKVSTLDLSQSLEVSEDTIRRDLKELSDLGTVRKVHGGAMLVSLNPFDYSDREVYALEEKQSLAVLAQALLRPGMVVFMDGGTTNVQVARLIDLHLPLTIFTNSLPVAEVLAEKPAVVTRLLGGRLLPSAKVTIGPEVVEQIRSVRADLCILGTRSLHPELGISEIDWDETQVKKAMVAASQELACLVISEKIGSTNPYLICPPTAISTLVSTLPLQHPSLLPFRRQGVDLLSPVTQATQSPS